MDSEFAGFVAADFNNDGSLDMATINRSLDVLAVLLGVGDGTFSSQLKVETSDMPGSVVTGDFNGCGNVDLVQSLVIQSKRLDPVSYTHLTLPTTPYV